MTPLHSRFYSACFDSFKIKSERQVFLSVKTLFYAVDYMVNEIKKTKKLSVVCKEGCSRCCYQHVSLITPSVFYLSESLKGEYSESKLFFIKKRLKKRSEVTALNGNNKYRVKCVFNGLTTGKCLIYKYRPEPCRRFIAVNENECLKSAGSPKQDDELIYEVELLSALLSFAAQKNELSIDSHDMCLSLFWALENPTLFKRWLNGETNIFPGVPWENYHQGLKELEKFFKVHEK